MLYFGGLSDDVTCPYLARKWYEEEEGKNRNVVVVVKGK